MISHNIRAFAFSILGLAFLIYALIFFATQDLSSLDFAKAISHVSTAVSINIIFWFLFIKWLWSWRIFYPWLVQVPNLNGMWDGEVRSNWKEDDAAPIRVEVSISQSFLNIQVRMTSPESRSFSIGASFDIDRDRGQQQLFFSYLNTPKSSVRDRSTIHYGSSLLSFGGFWVTEMAGEYWTSRETTGEVQLRRRTSA